MDTDSNTSGKLTFVGEFSESNGYKDALKNAMDMVTETRLGPNETIQVGLYFSHDDRDKLSLMMTNELFLPDTAFGNKHLISKAHVAVDGVVVTDAGRLERLLWDRLDIIDRDTERLEYILSSPEGTAEYHKNLTVGNNVKFVLTDKEAIGFSEYWCENYGQNPVEVCIECSGKEFDASKVKRLEFVIPVIILEDLIAHSYNRRTKKFDRVRFDITKHLVANFEDENGNVIEDLELDGWLVSTYDSNREFLIHAEDNDDTTWYGPFKFPAGVRTWAIQYFNLDHKG